MSDTFTIVVLATSSLIVVVAVTILFLRLGPLWDRFASTQVASLATRFAQLSMDVEQLKFFLRLWGATYVGGFLLLWFLLKSPPLAVLWSVAVYLAPRHILKYLIGRREKTLRDQLVVAAVGLSNSVKAGLSLAQGIAAIGRECPQPLAAELQRITFEFERGRPLKESIENVRLQLQLEPFTLFALAIETCLIRGGRVNEALERISVSLQEHQRLERKLEADTAAGRQVVLLLSLFPIVFLGMFYLLDPFATSLLFSTFAGQLVVVAVSTIVYLGVCWAVRIMHLEA